MMKQSCQGDVDEKGKKKKKENKNMFIRKKKNTRNIYETKKLRSETRGRDNLPSAQNLQPTKQFPTLTFRVRES